MEGTAKQIALAEKIRAEALDSLRAAGSAAPHFRVACQALSEAVSSITDSSWIISNRYNLGLKVGVLYGTDQPTITAQEVFYHQLLRNEFWREPRLRKGISTFTKERQAAIKALFQEAWRLERA
ncbi:hypothetical protein [Pseudomonas sp. UM16]|uniref:hypothetical protein n=1 Tax=Pseudomonas sp. UM16 TaxID=3158962 RepID=UPI0039902E1E